MTDGLGASLDGVLRTLQERAKELNCLYRVEEILRAGEAPLPELLQALVEALPPGWQHPAACAAHAQVRGHEARTPGYAETPWVQTAPVRVQGETVGLLSVAYTQALPEADEGPFLKEERRLLDTIAERLAQALLHRDLTPVFGADHEPAADPTRRQWRVVVDLLQRTDRALFRRIGRKLIVHLSVAGVAEAQALLRTPGGAPPDEDDLADDNRPLPRVPPENEQAAARAFELAARHLSQDDLYGSLQMWIKEDRVSFLLRALEDAHSSLIDVHAALDRYQHTGVDLRELSPARQKGLKVALIRRLLSEHPRFVDASARQLELEDFFDLMSHTVLLPKSHGRLGGKSSGLFLATRALRRAAATTELLRDVKVPRTWYLPSDGILQFVAHNGLDDVYDWRFRELHQVRQEYPHLLQVFKASRFPAEMRSGLSAALDDFGERPLIVRSSSLLEDSVSSAFSGKYKSLFLANQGPKSRRLEALLDAVAEVYASMFGPDPVQYRAERGLLEHHEEMAVMIQEVVGRRVGPWFLPAFAGVGLSHNELRWSPRIQRDDGLLRLVPGLGTRAVDRLADDYPVLVAPGQPGLRVNVTPDEVARYSPRKIDVLNLETGAFETVERDAFLERAGSEMPYLPRLLSLMEGGMLRRPDALRRRFARGEAVFTFEGLLRGTPFLARMRALLDTLRTALGLPVDVEFAFDGDDLYLLQCRAQVHGPDEAPEPIPRDLPRERVLFTARRYVSNGRVPDITHVVYVDPDGYGRIAEPERLRAVGRAVGRLNKLLPRRGFILMGPGRWGSRGDVRLGVSVTYADINNTALLIEIARRRGAYVPDVSFGTHFFQDLVEAGIRYLPLYPDQPDAVFNEAFFLKSENLLAQLVPEFASLHDVVHVIDVPRVSGGRMLRVLMNADAGEAVALLDSARNSVAERA
jgi:hypothetical protein